MSMEITITPTEAMDLLLAGNLRFTEENQEHPHQTAERRQEIVGGQKPFAVILTCSDSRVPPEVIFDQGLGSLFVIRVAGNVCDDIVLASVEYAIAHLGTPLVLVLGHAHCGAVTAAARGGDHEGSLPFLIQAIQPAVAAVKDAAGDQIENAIRMNAQLVAAALMERSPIVAAAVAADRVRIVAGHYDLAEGHVEIL